MLVLAVIALFLASILASLLGVSGGSFFVPVYSLFFNTEAKLPFYLSLISSITTLGTASVIYWKRNEIDFGLAKKFLKISIPTAIVGAVVSDYLDVKALTLAFSLFVFTYAFYLAKRFIEKYEYAPTDQINIPLVVIGGFMTGLVSFGVGTLMVPQCINKHCKEHTVAIGTTCLVVLFTVLVATVIRTGNELFEAVSIVRLKTIIPLAVPVVALGGIMGAMLVRHLDQKTIKIILIPVLLITGGLMLLKTIN